MFVPAGRVNLTYSEEKLNDAIPLIFGLRFKVMDLRFVPSDDLWQKTFTISLVMGQQIRTHLFPPSFVIVD